MKIDQAWLGERFACRSQREIFQQVWPKGIEEIDEEVIEEALSHFLTIEWACFRILKEGGNRKVWDDFFEKKKALALQEIMEMQGGRNVDIVSEEYRQKARLLKKALALRTLEKVRAQEAAACERGSSLRA